MKNVRGEKMINAKNFFRTELQFVIFKETCDDPFRPKQQFSFEK
jgi:hypothetical protein